MSQNYARIILGPSAAEDGIANNVEEAPDIVEKIGYPVLVRPSFVFGDRGLAYLKSQLAAGNKVPSQGNIFVSLKDEDKQKAVPLIKRLVDMGYNIYATRGTSTMLYNEGIKTRAVFRISRGRPNLKRPLGLEAEIKSVLSKFHFFGIRNIPTTNISKM